MAPAAARVRDLVAGVPAVPPVGRRWHPRRWLAGEIAAAGLLLLAGLTVGLVLGLAHTPWMWLASAIYAVSTAAGIILLQLRVERLIRDLDTMESREAALGAERELLLHEALAAADRERQRLAGDLHDGVIQLVSAVTLRTATLSRSLRRGSQTPAEGMEDAAASLDRITVDLQAVTVDLRTLMGALAGDDIQSDSMTGALSALLLPLTESGVTADVSIGELRCDAATRSLLHRVTQELVRNVAKHAAAHRVEVCVSQEGEVVTMSLADDGRGFDPAELDERRHRGHMGLRLLDQRVSDAGGALHLDATPRKGTRVTVTLPAAAAPQA